MKKMPVIDGIVCLALLFGMSYRYYINDTHSMIFLGFLLIGTIVMNEQRK